MPKGAFILDAPFSKKKKKFLKACEFIIFACFSQPPPLPKRKEDMNGGGTKSRHAIMFKVIYPRMSSIAYYYVIPHPLPPKFLDL